MKGEIDMITIHLEPRTKRLETTKSRLAKILNMTAEREGVKRGIKPDRSEESIKLHDKLVNEIAESFDECGYFIAYLGD